VFHVVNGECTAARLRESGIAGEIVDLDDIMAHGPVPNGLTSERDWETRAAWLAEHFAVTPAEYLARQSARVRLWAERGREVVVWSEFDLHCQANLLHLLTGFWTAGARAGALTLVCPGEVEGGPGFRGLGQLSGPQLAVLFARRTRLAGDTLSHAHAAWKAWCEPDPARLAILSVGPALGLEHLPRALAAHLRRFPWTTDGLDEIERTLLDLLPTSGTTFGALFESWNQTIIARPYGFGDWQIAHALLELSRGEEPPLAIESRRPVNVPACAAWHLRRTGSERRRWRGRARILGGVSVPATGRRWCYDPAIAALRSVDGPAQGPIGT
jgi:hypothetical protein